jgi:hypothetical protein
VIGRIPSLMFSSRTVRSISEVSYVLLVLLAACAIGLSCIDLLSQAVRTSANRSWTSNFNTLVIGASYLAVVRPNPSPHRLSRSHGYRQLVASLLFCVNRRVSVRWKLQRISNTYRGIGRGDAPQVVLIPLDSIRSSSLTSHIGCP